MDYLRKWPGVIPIPNQEAKTVADVVIEHWIHRFSVSMELKLRLELRVGDFSDCL